MSLETSHGLLVGLASHPLPLEVSAGARIVTALSEGDGVHRSVQLAVAASIQSPSLSLARGRWNGSGAGESTEGRLPRESTDATELAKDAASGDGGDANDLSQRCAAGLDRCLNLLLEFLGGGIQLFDPSQRVGEHLGTHTCVACDELAGRRQVRHAGQRRHGTRVAGADLSQDCVRSVVVARRLIQQRFPVIDQGL